MPRRSIVLAALLLSALPALAGEPFLVHDLNPDVYPLGSEPAFLTALGARALFLADDGEDGFELWASAGTAGDTVLLADICPGPCPSRISSFGRTDRLFFFTALPDEDEVEGRELWATDGRRAGTLRLTQPPLTLQTTQQGVVSASTGRQIYFVADDDVHGSEVWRSDGTPGGTHLVTDLRPGEEGSQVRAIATLGERLVFVGDDGRGQALWITDGTPAGTRTLLAPVSASQLAPEHLFRAGPYVYFQASAGASGRELWRTDGTAAGTVLVADLARGSASLTLLSMSRFGDRLLFVASTPALGQELWISNGTRAGTYALSSFASPEPFAFLGPFFGGSFSTDLGSRALFFADDGTHGREVWSTLGQRGDAQLVRDVCPGSCSGWIGFTGLRQGDLTFFYGDDGVRGGELWWSNGTSAGTRIVRDLCPGACSSYLVAIAAPGSKLPFFTDRFTTGTELWTWSAKPPTLQRLAAFPSLGAFGLLQGALAVGGRLFFAGGTAETGHELWQTDLTGPGTQPVREINPNVQGQSSYPQQLMRLGGQALFFAYSEPGGPTEGPKPAFWRSDGTSAGTSRLADGSTLLPGSPLAPRPLEAGGRLYFLAESPTRRTTFWRSDGTTAGTVALTPDDATAQPSRVAPAAAGGRVLFVAYTRAEGEEPWVSDGTPGGTHLLADLDPGGSSSSPFELTPFQGKVYFSASSPNTGGELWVSDGTAAGTKVVKDLAPQLGASSSPSGLVAHGGFLYFEAGDFGSRKLWKTDGSEAGTVAVLGTAEVPGLRQATPALSALGRLFLILDLGADGRWLAVSDGTPAAPVRLLNLPPLNSRLSPLVAAGGQVFFTRSSDLGLWVTDGTAGGTHAVVDSGGASMIGADKLSALGGQVVFTRFEDAVWVSDGTPAGTRRLGRDKAHGFFDQFVVVGDLVLGAYADPGTGVELWGVRP